MAIDWDYERSRCLFPKDTKSGNIVSIMPKDDGPSLLDELEEEVDNMPHADLVAKVKRGDNGNRQS